MQSPFPLFGALNVPYRIIELLHTNRHRELLRASCRFDSCRERCDKAIYGLKNYESLLLYIFDLYYDLRKKVKILLIVPNSYVLNI